MRSECHPGKPGRAARAARLSPPTRSARVRARENKISLSCAVEWQQLSEPRRGAKVMRQGFDLGQFGRVLANLDTQSFMIAEKGYAPSLRIPRHAHDTVVMSFPLAGSFIESNSSSR